MNAKIHGIFEPCLVSLLKGGGGGGLRQNKFGHEFCDARVLCVETLKPKGLFGQFIFGLRNHVFILPDANGTKYEADGPTPDGCGGIELGHGN